MRGAPPGGGAMLRFSVMTKTDLHQLVDALPADSVDAVGRWLERVIDDPMIAVLDASAWDDEPFTPDEDTAVEEARASIARGEGIPWDQVKAELGVD